MSRRLNNRHAADRQRDMDDLARGMPSRPGVRRQARRWGKFTLKILIILSILTGTVYGVNHLWKRFVVANQDFQLKTIQFETNGHMTEPEIRKILGLSGSENVMFLDIKGLEETLKSRPDIVRATINRQLPATLVIELEERVPVAWLECSQDHLFGRDKKAGLLVDSSGYIFSYDPELHKRYEASPVMRVTPPLDGHYAAGEWLEGTSARHGLSFLRTSKSFLNEGLPFVESIDFVNDWSFVAHFADGMDITFGLFDHERQLHDLALILQHAHSTNRSVQSANMIPARNTPVVFGKKREQPIVRAEELDEEAEPMERPARPDRQPVAEPVREAVTAPAAPRERAGRRSAQDEEEARRAAMYSSGGAAKKADKETSGKEASSDKEAAPVRKAKTSSSKPAAKKAAVRAAEVVDEEEKSSPAPKKKTTTSKTKSSKAKPSKSSETSGKSTTVPKPKVSKKTTAKPKSTSNSGSGKSSSGSSAQSPQKAPAKPAAKKVEVPSFNW